LEGVVIASSNVVGFWARLVSSIAIWTKPATSGFIEKSPARMLTAPVSLPAVDCT